MDFAYTRAWYESEYHGRLYRLHEATLLYDFARAGWCRIGSTPEHYHALQRACHGG